VLNLEKVHVIAHDMGVITAIQLAYGYPQRVHSLVHLSVPPAFIKISLKALPAFKHLPQFFVHKSGASLRHVFSKDFLARPLSETDIDNYLLPMQRPAVDGAVRHLYRGMVFQEALRMASGAYRRQTLTVPTLIVLGRPGKPWTEELVVQGCPHPDQYASQLEFSYIENAAHFITDDDPAGVAHVLINWLQHAKEEK
jgi:pimeloyl-ACP methyl ester carboxylesterase